MENTTPFLFDHANPRYFLAIHGSVVGPLTAQEVFERINGGTVGLLHYIWREDWENWKRICDEQEFALLIPKKPMSGSIQKLHEKISSKEETSVKTGGVDQCKYYLYFNRTQFGPFSKNELIHLIETQKLDTFSYLWIPGWPNWKRLVELEEFASYFQSESLSKPEKQQRPAPLVELWKSKTSQIKKTKKKSQKSLGIELQTQAGIDVSERRAAPRKPLVARLFLHNNQDIVIAVCRDVSVGGMQVLTDRIPGDVGTRIKLNVSPGDPKKVKSFVAEGEIVRILEDRRGFSFRFTKIKEEARLALLRYLKT